MLQAKKESSSSDSSSEDDDKTQRFATASAYDFSPICVNNQQSLSYPPPNLAVLRSQSQGQGWASGNAREARGVEGVTRRL